MSELLTYELNGAVATIVMDDGKVNVMSAEMLRALNQALDRAENDNANVVLAGREGIFSAGFDTKTLARADPDETYEMMRLGSELALRVLSYSRPFVTACTGHAFPMGAFLMLSADVRLGIEGPYKIGLNEVTIGLTLPHFAVELARARVTPSYFNRIVTGELLQPQEAIVAGYLDRIVPKDQLLQTAQLIAMQLTAVDMPSHTATKKRIRAHAIEAVRNAIDSEITPDFYRDRTPRH